MSSILNGNTPGGALPTASGAGQIPVSDGAGTAYTATDRATVVADGLSDMIGGQAAGTAAVSDGAGGLTLTSADVSALLTATDAAAARTAIGAQAAPTTTVYDFASSTGFTLQANTGTAAITAGVARLSHAAGTAYRTLAVAYDGPAITRALAWPTDGPVEVAVRLAVAPSVARTVALLEIASALTGGVRVAAAAQHDRTVFIYREDTNATTSSTAGAFAAYTGQEWLKLRAASGVISVYVGVGVAGARPTAWTLIGTLSVTAVWSHVAVGLVVVGTSSTSTVDFDDLTTLETPVVTL